MADFILITDNLEINLYFWKYWKGYLDCTIYKRFYEAIYKEVIMILR
jgi:hypothetical protein